MFVFVIRLPYICFTNFLFLFFFPEMGFDRYKMVVQVVIGEQRGEGVLWVVSFPFYFYFYKFLIGYSSSWQFSSSCLCKDVRKGQYNKMHVWTEEILVLSSEVDSLGKFHGVTHFHSICRLITLWEFICS